MSIAEKVTIAIGIVGAVFAGYQTWDILDRRHDVSAAFQAVMWIAVILVIAYAIYGNLKDARRSKGLQADITRIRDEHREQLALHDRAIVVIVQANESLKAQLQQKELEATASHTLYLRQVELYESMRRQVETRRRGNTSKELRTW